LSSGAITYLLTTSQHQLFYLNQFLSSISTKEGYLENLDIPKILHFTGLIMYLPKNKPISLLELKPYKAVQYIRSTGVFGLITKMDLRVHTALIKMPSGVRKVFSTHALGSTGAIALHINKNYLNNYAGFRKKKGYKSIVRGVAMNPVDHPHGGRAKSIKYQRTP
jgi:large subunit ribosomal protein L2